SGSPGERGRGSALARTGNSVGCRLDVSQIFGLARLHNDGHDPGRSSWRHDQLMFETRYEALHPKTSVVVRDDGAGEFRRYEAHTLHMTGKLYLGRWFAVCIHDTASDVAMSLELDGERPLLVAPQDHAHGQVLFLVGKEECAAAPGIEPTHREGVGLQNLMMVWPCVPGHRPGERPAVRSDHRAVQRLPPSHHDVARQRVRLLVRVQEPPRFMQFRGTRAYHGICHKITLLLPLYPRPAENVLDFLFLGESGRVHPPLGGGHRHD